MVFIVGRFDTHDTEIVNNAVNQAFEEQGVVKAFEDCAEFAHYNVIPMAASSFGAATAIEPSAFKFAECWNCHSYINLPVLAKTGGSYDGTCPVCKKYDKSVTQEEWATLFNDDETPTKTITNEGRKQAFQNSPKIPWREKKRKWVAPTGGYYNRGGGHYVDDGEVVLTDRETLTRVRPLFHRKYEDKVEVARKKVKAVYHAKNEAVKRAHRKEPQWIVVCEYTSAHY
jgi:hypothetical protein